MEQHRNDTLSASSDYMSTQFANCLMHSNILRFATNSESSTITRNEINTTFMRTWAEDFTTKTRESSKEPPDTKKTNPADVVINSADTLFNLAQQHAHPWIMTDGSLWVLPFQLDAHKDFSTPKWIPATASLSIPCTLFSFLGKNWRALLFQEAEVRVRMTIHMLALHSMPDELEEKDTHGLDVSISLVIGIRTVQFDCTIVPSSHGRTVAISEVFELNPRDFYALKKDPQQQQQHASLETWQTMTLVMSVGNVVPPPSTPSTSASHRGVEDGDTGAGNDRGKIPFALQFLIGVYMEEIDQDDRYAAQPSRLLPTDEDRPLPPELIATERYSDVNLFLLFTNEKLVPDSFRFLPFDQSCAAARQVPNAHSSSSYDTTLAFLLAVRAESTRRRGTPPPPSLKQASTSTLRPSLWGRILKAAQSSVTAGYAAMQNALYGEWSTYTPFLAQSGSFRGGGCGEESALDTFVTRDGQSYLFILKNSREDSETSSKRGRMSVVLHYGDNGGGPTTVGSKSFLLLTGRMYPLSSGPRDYILCLLEFENVNLEKIGRYRRNFPSSMVTQSWMQLNAFDVLHERSGFPPPESYAPFTLLIPIPPETDKIYITLYIYSESSIRTQHMKDVRLNHFTVSSNFGKTMEQKKPLAPAPSRALSSANLSTSGNVSGDITSVPGTIDTENGKPRHDSNDVSSRGPLYEAIPDAMDEASPLPDPAVTASSEPMMDPLSRSNSVVAEDQNDIFVPEPLPSAGPIEEPDTSIEMYQQSVRSGSEEHCTNPQCTSNTLYCTLSKDQQVLWSNERIDSWTSSYLQQQPGSSNDMWKDFHRALREAHQITEPPSVAPPSGSSHAPETSQKLTLGSLRWRVPYRTADGGTRKCRSRGHTWSLVIGSFFALTVIVSSVYTFVIMYMQGQKRIVTQRRWATALLPSQQQLENEILDTPFLSDSHRSVDEYFS